MVRATLGTATTKKGKAYNFQPATISPSTSKKRTPRPVDLLFAEIDESPVAEAMTLALGGMTLSELSLDAVPCEPQLLIPDTPKLLQFTPRFEFRFETRPAAELFPVERLQRLNALLKKEHFQRGLRPDGWPVWQFTPVKLDDLPEEVECVIATSLKYDHLGEVFRSENKEVVVGIRGQSVAELEQQLRIDHSSNPIASDELRRHLQGVRLRRRERRALRPTVQSLLHGVESALCDKKKRLEIVAWIYGDWQKNLTPAFLAESFNGARTACTFTAHRTWPSLEADIRERIREMTATQLAAE